MLKKSGIGWLALLLTCTTVVSAEIDEGLFRDLSLDRARKAASDGGKQFVLVDFYTVWCGPCKKLDETTWKDPGVQAWLSKEAICLKVDAEKDEALASKFRINAYPTVLLLRPDGTEIDRLVGYRDAKSFLADTRDALAGNDSLSRARKKLEGSNATDPMLRMSYGDALAQKGRAEDALSEYLWCFDHGLEHGPGFTGVRLSFLLSRIAQLGHTFPQALEELRKRRDSSGKMLEAGKADFGTAMGFTALNSNLAEPEKTLAMYDRIKRDKAQPVGVREYLFDQSLDQLLKAKRYKEVVADLDVKSKVGELIADHERMKGHLPNDAGLRAHMKRQVCVNAAKYYEALLGSGNQSVAGEVVATLAGFDAAEAFPQLIAAAKRAGDTRTADALVEESRKSTKAPAKPQAPKATE